MSEAKRGVSTAADATLAIVVIVAALAVLVAFVETPGGEHEPVEAEYTAATVAGSTTNTTYDVSEAVEALEREDFPFYDDYSAGELERVTHGPVAAQAADVAVANVEFGGERLSVEATDYERVLDEKLQAVLVHARFDTQVVAVWQPLEGAGVRGTTELGQPPPVDADVSTTTMTVPSGVPEAREEALAAVEDGGEFEAVARSVANATIEGYLPELGSQRALESSGLDYYLTTYRYVRMAAVLAGSDPGNGEFEEWLVPFESPVDAGAANAYLSEHLAAELADRVEQRYDSPGEAASAVSTGRVTITIRTWT